MVVWTLKLLIVVLVVGFSACVKVDKIQAFYDLLNSNPGVKHCPDKTRLLPGCTNCIPGMKEGKSKTCDEFTTASADIRAEIKKLTLERYGDNMDPKRPFGLYPCEYHLVVLSNVCSSIHAPSFRFRVAGLCYAARIVWKDFVGHESSSKSVEMK